MTPVWPSRGGLGSTTLRCNRGAGVQPTWGGTDFHVRDPDGNVVSFVEFR
jgi:hypothetical protein